MQKKQCFDLYCKTIRINKITQGKERLSFHFAWLPRITHLGLPRVLTFSLYCPDEKYNAKAIKKISRFFTKKQEENTDRRVTSVAIYWSISCDMVSKRE